MTCLARNLEREKRPLIAFLLLLVAEKTTLRSSTWMGQFQRLASGCHREILLLSALSPRSFLSKGLRPFLSSLFLFLSLSYAIYLTITLSAYLIKPNAFFLLLLAITVLFCLSSFSLFAREDAYCQFRERTVNRDELHLTISEMKGSVTFPYNKINSRHQNDEITKGCAVTR